MKATTLKDLFVEELKDIYHAEGQLIKALPKMAKAATCEDLKAGFEEHLAQTREHVKRLETIFESLDMPARGKKCEAMEGLIEEGGEAIDLEGDNDTRDAALIGAAQKVEHYEIATYGTLKAWARQLEMEDVVSLLKATLDEEKDTDDKLTELAMAGINEEAETEDEEEEVTARK